VRLPVDDGVLVMDPFNRGRPLDEDELRQRARPHLNGEAPDDRALFQILNPATHRAILCACCATCMACIPNATIGSAHRAAPTHPAPVARQCGRLRDRGLAYMKMGIRQGAAGGSSRVTCSSTRKHRTAARCASASSNSAAGPAKTN
jgi:regulator of sirC expression with transglutaminase-like and TPR domain